MFGDAIKDARLRRNMTQNDLGILVGRSKQAVSRLESSRGELTLTMMIKLATALKVSPVIFLPTRFRKSVQKEAAHDNA